MKYVFRNSRVRILDEQDNYWRSELICKKFYYLENKIYDYAVVLHFKLYGELLSFFLSYFMLCIDLRYKVYFTAFA